MATNSKIEWTDHTWNPWYGCPDDGRRSPACDNCYARSWAKRFGSVDFDREIKRASDKTFNAPLNCKKYKSGDKVFVCSLSDFFHPAVDPRLRLDAFISVVMERPDLIWIFLTKRPECVGEWGDWDEPGNNHWLGVTVENQEQADKRIPLLLEIPAAVRFVSCEPLLESICIWKWLKPAALNYPKSWPTERMAKAITGGVECGDFLPTLDWVICGGESGPGARPMHPDWARSLRDQCSEAGMPFMFKQWGEYVPCFMVEDETEYNLSMCNGTIMCLVGKKDAGRLLDGVEHLEFPEVQNA